MTKLIELPDDLHKRTQLDAVPFVDLNEIAVIRRWADYYEANHKEALPIPSVVPTTSIASRGDFSPLMPPDLQHTRVSGTFGSTTFRKWNDLVRTAHIKAFAKAKTFDELRLVTHAQIEPGNREGERGFHFVPEIGLSIQGVDANKAWEYSFRLAQYCKLPIRAQVEWRHNDKAAHPGKVGSLFWTPENPSTEIICP